MGSALKFHVIKWICNSIPGNYVYVKLVDKELDNYVFTGTFQEDSLVEVLHLLCFTSQFGYQFVEPKLMDDRT
jgi:hypothetical protein